jgi:hypothetical protein
MVEVGLFTEEDGRLKSNDRRLNLDGIKGTAEEVDKKIRAKL